MAEKTKRTMTLNLTAREMAALEALCAKKDLSKTAVMRLALRLLQAADAKLRAGQMLMFENRRTKEKSELLIV